MDLRQLRYFLAVADCGSFSEAARRLHIAQPAISTTVRKLENELELRLLHRGDNGVTRTAEGEALARHARRLLSQLADAELEMRELKGLTKGEVRVGLPSMLGSYYFPPLLMGFNHRYPDLKLTVVEAGARSLQQSILDGTLDLGVIVADEVPENLEARHFAREEMVACAAPDHPFASRGSISTEDLFDQDLVLFKTGYFHREFIDRIGQESGREPHVVFETNLIGLSKAIVAQGFAVTTFLRRVVEDDPRLVAIAFDPPVFLDVSMAWKQDGYLSQADRAFLDYVFEQQAIA
jgi:DNA-binding transcriptional LysR family regulator